MTFSGYNTEQRSREAKALKSVLTYSLIGSTALHIGLLALGMGNFLARVPQEPEEPIEITMVDPVTEEVEKPPQAVLAESKTDNSSQRGSQNSGGGGGGSNSQIAIANSGTQLITKAEVQPIFQRTYTKVSKPEITNQSPPVQKVVENFKTPQVQEQQQKITDPIGKTEPVNNLSQEIVTEPEAPTKSATDIPTTNQNSNNLSRLFSRLRDSQTTQANVSTGTSSNLVPSTTGTDKNTASGTGNGIGNGTGNGIGNGVGNGTGNGTGDSNSAGNPSTVATAPTPPKIQNPGKRRVRCLGECKLDYPEAARRRKYEGRVVLTVDADAQGNVINVKITRSTGHQDIDEEVIRQAPRKIRLEPTKGGIQGLPIAIEITVRNSQRDRQVQERKRRREAEARNQQRTRQQETTAQPPLQPVESTNTTSSPTKTGTVTEDRGNNNSAPEAPNNTNQQESRENGTSSSQNKVPQTLPNSSPPVQPEPTTPPTPTTPATEE